MGDLINLNKARKARDRLAAKVKAAENRTRFGQGKGSRDRKRKETERLEKDLDGKKLD